MDASTTIRIAAADKRRLARLQAAWTRARGEAPSQQDLLGQGLRFLEEHQPEFLDEMAGTAPTDAEWDAFLRPVGSYPGVAARDIDRTLYGA